MFRSSVTFVIRGCCIPCLSFFLACICSGDSCFTEGFQTSQSFLVEFLTYPHSATSRIQSVNCSILLSIPNSSRLNPILSIIVALFYELDYRGGSCPSDLISFLTWWITCSDVLDQVFGSIRNTFLRMQFVSRLELLHKYLQSHNSPISQSHNCSNSQSLNSSISQSLISSISQSHSCLISQSLISSISQSHSCLISQSHTCSNSQSHNGAMIAQTHSCTIAQIHRVTIALIHSGTIAKTHSGTIAKIHTSSSSQR